MAYLYTLRKEDIGARTIHVDGRPYCLPPVLGFVLPRDVGKRLYINKDEVGMLDALSVENDEQRDRRLGWSGYASQNDQG